jgi:uncharacterized membrane protein
MGRQGRTRDESGAVLPLVAVLSSVIILFAAFAVDLGSQRVLRRDLQAMADVIALDMARQLDGRTQAVLKATNDWRTQLKLSTERNLNMDPAPAVSVQQLQREAIATVAGTDIRVTAVMGLLDPVTGEFSEIPYPDVPTAVQVTTTGSVDFSFTPGSGSATRSAVGAVEGSACIKVGSFALGLSSNASVLRTILGNSAALRVLSYGGLTTANVSLLGLAAKLGVGTPDALVKAPNITAGQLLTASAALFTEAGGTANATLASQLGQVRTDLGALASEKIDFAEILSLGQGNGSALDSRVNVLDLLTSGLIVANGVNAVAVPDLNLNVLGSNLTARVSIIEAPVIACNDGVAKTAQGFVELSGTINLTVLGAGVKLTNLRLRVSLARASAQLTPDGAGCTTDSVSVDVFDQTLANVRLSADVELGVKVLFVDVFSKIGTIDTGEPQPAPSASYPLPLPNSYTEPVTTNSGTIGLDLSNADVTVVGLNVGALVGALAPLVSGVSSLLTTRLLPALGLTTAGADLFALPEPTCESPVLRG